VLECLWADRQAPRITSPIVLDQGMDAFHLVYQRDAALTMDKFFLAAEHPKRISAFVCPIHQLTSAYDHMASFMLRRSGRGFPGLTKSTSCAPSFEDGEDRDLALSNGDVFAFLRGDLGDHNGTFYCT
jgi:hypothetical protein